MTRPKFSDEDVKTIEDAKTILKTAIASLAFSEDAWEDDMYIDVKYTIQNIDSIMDYAEKNALTYDELIEQNNTLNTAIDRACEELSQQSCGGTKDYCIEHNSYCEDCEYYVMSKEEWKEHFMKEVQ